MKRPTAVTVIGAIWIALGILVLSSALAESVVLSLALCLQEEAWSPQDYLGLVLMFLGVTGGVFAIFAAIRFLRCRRWAWISLRVLSWIGLVLTFVYLINDIRLTWHLTDQFGFAHPNICISSFIVQGIQRGLLCVMFAAGFVAMMRFLRSETVREAVGVERASANDSSEGGEMR